MQLVQRGGLLEASGALVQPGQGQERRRIVGRQGQGLRVAGAGQLRGVSEVKVQIAGDQEVSRGGPRIRLAGRARTEPGAALRRLAGGDVGLGQRGDVAAGQRVALAQGQDRQIGRLAGGQRGEQRARRVAVAAAEQGVGAAQGQAEGAGRIRLLRLPALDQLGQLVVLAQALGQVGQVGDEQRLAGQERDGLLQIAPRALGVVELLGRDAGLAPAHRDELAAQADRALGLCIDRR